MNGLPNQLVGGQRRTATVRLVVAIAVLFWANPETLLAQAGGGNAGPSVGVQHVLTVEHALGSLVPRGFLPLRVTIARQGPSAACQRDMRYWVVSNSPEHGGGGFRRLTDAAEMVLGKGGTTLTGDVVLRPGSGWNNTVFVESDGNLSYFSGQGDHGVFHDSVVTNFGTNSTNVQCLFVGKDQLDDVDTCMLTENTRQRYRNQMQGNGSMVRAPPPTTGNPVPSVWYLNEILGQANLETYQQWRGGLPSFAPPTATVRPDRIDAAAHLETFRAQQFIGWTSPDRLPTEWQGLLAADFVFLSMPTLKSLASGQRPAYQALRDWVAAGGRLVVSECGNDLAGLREVETDLFQLASGERRNSWRTMAWSAVAEAIDQRKFELGSPPEVPAIIDENGYPQPAEVLPRLGLATGPDDAGLTNQGHTVFTQRDLLTKLVLATSRFDPGDPPGEGETVFADLGAGRIIAMPGSNADWQMGDWKRMLVTAICDAPGPLMIDSFSTSAWQALPEAQMPGIGRPPWLPFIALIILFVIGVGPVAYTILERRKRVPWILAIVPGVATACTLGLLVYALASEGLGSRSVRFSFTRLDQQNRVALTRTHLIGYSGIAPGGYRFEREEVLFPDENPRYDLTTVADPEGRSIRGGGIRPRTVHQLQVSRVASSDRSLRVVAPAGGATEWEVTNRLGSDCGPVIVRTAEGYLCVDNLASGETIRLLPADQSGYDTWVQGQFADPDSSLERALRLQLRVFEPDFLRLWRPQFGDLSDYYSRGVDHVDRIQENLRRILAAFGAGEEHERLVSEGCFFALATDNPEAARFPHRTRDMGELHLIHGRW
jgi:hypothetical protein